MAPESVPPIIAQCADAAPSLDLIGLVVALAATAAAVSIAITALVIAP